MVFPGWRVELEGTWKSSALRRINHTWLYQPYLTINISDVGETHNLYTQSTSSASSFLSLDKNAFFNFHCKSSIFAPCTSNRENRLCHSFEKPITSYQGGSQSLIVAKTSSWKDVYPFENHLWTNFPLIIIAFEEKQSLFAFLSC